MKTEEQKLAEAQRKYDAQEPKPDEHEHDWMHVRTSDDGMMNLFKCRECGEEKLV
jgi:DNA-directed RNA polymerase subunit M/transcription elongation factor TFIIS